MSTVGSSGVRRLGVLLVVVGGLAVSFWALAAGSALREPAPSPWRLLALTGLLLLANVTVLHLRFGHNKESYTWAEVAVLLGLVLVPPAWIVVLTAPCVTLTHLLRRLAPVKVAFNASTMTVGASLATLVYTPLAGAAEPGGARSLLALGLAALVFWGWNGATVVAAVAFSQGLSWTSVYRRGWRVRFAIGLGNTAVLVSVVALAYADPLSLLTLPVIMVLLYAAYRARLRAMEEREMWQGLQAASRELHQPRLADLVAVVLDRSRSLFVAEFVEVTLLDEGRPGWAEVARWDSDRGRTSLCTRSHALPWSWPAIREQAAPVQLTLPRCPPYVEAAMRELGLHQAHVVPLESAQGTLGTLTIGFHGEVRIRQRELQLLTTFANSVGTALTHARLFESTRDQREQLARVIDNSSDGIFTVSGSGRVLSWNPAMAAITGRTPDCVRGAVLDMAMRAWDEHGEPLTADWLARQVDRSGGHASALAGVQSISGGESWLQLSVDVVGGAEGFEESYVVVARDVTARRRVEQAKEDFVATVSHELRTPLTSLKGFLLTLLRPNFQPARADLDQIHGRMLHQAERLQRLVEDLLTVSTFERGEFILRLEAIDLGELADRVVRDFRPEHGPRRLEVVRTGAEDARLLVLADAGRVEQVLTNLLSNADKYTPEGAPVLVRVEPGAGAEAQRVWVRVIDHGAGIAEDSRDDVFQPFRRLGNHLTRPVGGSGLGLHIVRQLVEAMGGRVLLEETPGGGATFSFALPVAPADAHAGGEVARSRRLWAAS